MDRLLLVGDRLKTLNTLDPEHCTARAEKIFPFKSSKLRSNAHEWPHPAAQNVRTLLLAEQRRTRSASSADTGISGLMSCRRG
ncbi:hypothetical protein [Pseudomonas syringae]|uniref:hypothetical protein n=1 Tax=Pseudomonas syringae TaxID=317 RepID=UPI0018E5E4FA|nr:hypothetical protein [Pseudomonas syringae]MBI6753222.1 hypothetical protein [Pseudomonas syringae]MBI6773629.1 hypothetical protein [Pseudomonas syringae]MBI6777665.1 hypothetical protein [Pseudomonas syringae]MBI6790682.1 hypothetical protein [Pseudomonas syringae]MBI6799412.1 hypothetical protein [Pseudomonas syringae]